MRILLSCFEPFGKRKRNTSADLVLDLPKRVKGFEIHNIILPVVHRKAGPALLNAIRKFKPELVIAFGESGRKLISLERFALNYIHSPIPDNSGKTLKDSTVLRGAPLALPSSLPLNKIKKALENKKVPVEISLSAGGFLCNEVFYVLQYHFRKTKAFRSGFIHVPALPESENPLKSWRGKNPLEVILKACL